MGLREGVFRGTWTTGSRAQERDLGWGGGLEVMGKGELLQGDCRLGDAPNNLLQRPSSKGGQRKNRLRRGLRGTGREVRTHQGGEECLREGMVHSPHAAERPGGMMTE